MKRILSILLSAIMVIAILPVSVFMVAAEDTVLATFEFGANGAAGHVDGNKLSTSTQTESGYTLTLTSLTNVYGPAYDAKGNSCIKLGTSSKTGSFSFTVPDDVTSVVINVAKYKTNTTKITVNGTAYTLTNASNNGAYDAITVDTTSTKTVTFATVSGGVRAMVNSIVFHGAPAEGACDHVNANEADCTNDSYCPDCDTVIKNALGHTYDFENAVCTECGEDIVEMTIPEILEVEVGTAVVVKGTVDRFYQEWNDSYGNCAVIIVDDEGNELTVYATSTRLGIGDEITVTGAVSSHNETNQIDGKTAKVVIDAKHECEYTELTCTEDSVCKYCGALGEEAPGHNYVDGTCTECGEAKPAFSTLDFAEDGNRTSYSTTQQVWEANGIVFTNDKASSTTNIRNNLSDNHVRLYVKSSVTIEYTGITKIVFHCASDYVLKASDITVGTVSVDGTTVTVELEEAVDSYTIESISVQTRINSIEVYAEASEPEPTPEPEYIRIDGYQTTDVVDGKYNVRFVAAIGELVEGQKLFGFDITATYTENGVEMTKSWDKTTHTVYSSITANYGTDVVTAEEIGAAYVTAMAITGVPTSAGAVTFVVKPYTVINGETVYGAAVEIVVTPTVAE